MISETVKLLWNNPVGPGYFRMGLKGHVGYAQAKPGQFVMVRLADRLFPLLRRPFSIHRLIESQDSVEGIEILYKIVGKGTRALGLCRPGDDIDLLGPLGNGFVIPTHCEQIFIIAGGIGVAPMVFLTSSLIKSGMDSSQCTIFLGGRTKTDLLCVDEFARFGTTVHVTTDDGSAGDTCFITEPLLKKLNHRRPDIIFACGPMEMIRCVATAAARYQIPCQVSVETVMACGMGACLGCALESKNSAGKYLHACVDGPVFDASILQL